MKLATPRSSFLYHNRLPSLLEGMETRLLYSTTVLNRDGTVMGRLEDSTAPVQYVSSTRKGGSASSDSSPGFQITLAFGGGLTDSQQSAFRSAAARWERVLTADLPDVVINGIAIDDIQIVASGAYIDGVGTILGRAGPTYVRGDNLPCAGAMTFDTSDLANMESKGTLPDVITHEMGHVLGIGSLWGTVGLLQGPSTPTGRIFVGPNALNEYVAYRGPGGFNSAGVPVETDGSAGTADSHWDEDTFGNELMTGYIGSAGNPLSRMTAASLIDLGYPGVNVDAAEGYSHSGWNVAPFIYGFNSNQLTAYANTNLTLSVANATDADGSPLITKFYRESNGVPGLQSTSAVTNSPHGSAIESDTLVATMSYGVLGATFNIGNLGIGAYTYYGQSYDIYHEPSGVVSRTINVIAPPPPVPSIPDLLTAVDTGDSGTDNITGLQDLVFTGYAEPNSTVQLLLNGIGTQSSRQADGAGYYNIPLRIAIDGTYAISAKATNTTGTGPASPSMAVTVDTVSPTISGGYYDREVTQDVSVQVSDRRASELNWYYTTVTNLSTATAGAAIQSLSSSVNGDVAQLAFNSRFANGHYRITFPLGSVSDVAGNISPAYNFDFTQLNGDANGDGVVNFADLLVLAQHYNTTGNHFSAANFDYSADGKVDFSDLLIFAQNYNASLPAGLMSATAGGTTTSDPFGRRGVALAGLVEPQKALVTTTTATSPARKQV